MQSSQAVLIFIVAGFFFVANAYPYGAGGCSGGMPAVGPPHLAAAEVNNGTLAFLNMTVNIDGTVLDPGSTFSIVAGVEHTIQVIAPNQNLRGVLVRLQAPDGVDTSLALLPLDRTKVADVCVAPVVGITHFRANDKFDASGILRFEQEVDSIILDVTTVKVNNAQLSEFGYNRFIGEVIAAPPSIAPTSSTPTTSAPSALSSSTQVPATPSVSTPTPTAPSSITLPPISFPPTTRTSAPSTAKPTSDSPVVVSDAPSDVPSDVPSVVPSGAPSIGPTIGAAPSQLPSSLSSPAPAASNSTGTPSLAPFVQSPSVTFAPTAPQLSTSCALEEQLLTACFQSKLGDAASACDFCVATNVPKVAPSCDELSTSICTVVGTDCSCGDCRDAVVDFLNCAYRKVIDCTVNCTFSV